MADKMNNSSVDRLAQLTIQEISRTKHLYREQIIDAIKYTAQTRGIALNDVDVPTVYERVYDALQRIYGPQ